VKVTNTKGDSILPALAVFARTPVAGRAKTRLMPMLGAGGAAELQGALISDAIRKLRAVRHLSALYLFLAGRTSATTRMLSAWDTKGRMASRHREPAIDALHSTLTVLRQRGAGLGERLEQAFRFLLRSHPAAVVLGTDSPLLPIRLLEAAIRELGICDSVLGPCPDGGYYLIGLRRCDLPRPAGALQASHSGAWPSEASGPDLFRGGIFANVRWGTRFSFADTLHNLLERGLSCSVLQPVSDVDRSRDLSGLQQEFVRRASARRLAPSTWRFLKGRAFGASRRGPSRPCGLREA